MEKTEEERFMIVFETVIDIIEHSLRLLEGNNIKCPVSSSNIPLAKVVITSNNPKDIMEKFITQSSRSICGVTIWNLIKSKNEDWLINNSGVLFKNLPFGNWEDSDLFRIILTAKGKDNRLIIDEKLKSKLWDNLHALVKISIKFIHRERCPVFDGENKYTKDYFNDIDIPKEANEWKIPLKKGAKK